MAQGSFQAKGALVDITLELNEHIETLKRKKLSFKKSLVSKLLKLLQVYQNIAEARDFIQVLKKLENVEQTIFVGIISEIKRSIDINEMVSYLFEELVGLNVATIENLHRLLGIIKKERVSEYSKAYLDAWLECFKGIHSQVNPKDKAYESVTHRLSVLYSLNTGISPALSLLLKEMLIDANLTEFLGLRNIVLNNLLEDEKDHLEEIELLAVFPFQEDLKKILNKIIDTTPSPGSLRLFAQILLVDGILSEKHLTLVEEKSFIRNMTLNLEKENFKEVIDLFTLIVLSLTPKHQKLMKQFNTNKVLKNLLSHNHLNSLTKNEAKSVGYLLWALLAHLPLYTSKNQLNEIFGFLDSNSEVLEVVYYEVYSVLLPYKSNFDSSFVSKPFDQVVKSLSVNIPDSNLIFMVQVIEFYPEYIKDVESVEILSFLENSNSENRYLAWKLLQLKKDMDVSIVHILFLKYVLSMSFNTKALMVLETFLRSCPIEIKQSLCQQFDTLYSHFLQAVKENLSNESLMKVLMNILFAIALDAYSLKQCLAFLLIVLSLSGSPTVQEQGWLMILMFSKEHFKKLNLSKDTKSSLYYRIYNVSKVRFEKEELRLILLAIYYELEFFKIEPQALIDLIAEDKNLTESKEEIVLNIFERVEHKILLEKIDLKKRSCHKCYESSLRLRRKLDRLLKNSSKREIREEDPGVGSSGATETKTQGTWSEYFSSFFNFGNMNQWLGRQKV